MKCFRSVSLVIGSMALSASFQAIDARNLANSKTLPSEGFQIPMIIFQEPIRRESHAYRSQPGWEPHVFCTTQTPEQIGFVIATLEALANDGVLIKGRADSFIAKLQSARSNAGAVNVPEVFSQLEDFIIKVDAMIRQKRLTATQGQQLIDSTLGVVCRG